MLEDHYEPRQACKSCKHINVDTYELPCCKCKYNQRLEARMVQGDGGVWAGGIARDSK